MPDALRKLEEQQEKYGQRKEEALIEGNLRKAKVNNTRQQKVGEQAEQLRRQWEEEKAARQITVTENDVAAVVAAWTGIP